MKATIILEGPFKCGSPAYHEYKLQAKIILDDGTERIQLWSTHYCFKDAEESRDSFNHSAKQIENPQGKEFGKSIRRELMLDETCSDSDVIGEIGVCKRDALTGTKWLPEVMEERDKFELQYRLLKWQNNELKNQMQELKISGGLLEE